MKSFTGPIKKVINKIPEPIAHYIIRNGVNYVWYGYDNIPRLDFHKIVFPEGDKE